MIPFARACDGCGRPMLIRPTQVGRPVKCLACGKEHGPFREADFRGEADVGTQPEYTGPGPDEPESFSQTEVAAAGPERRALSTSDPPRAPRPQSPAQRALKRLAGRSLAGVGTALMFLGGVVVFGGVRAEGVAWIVAGTLLGAGGGGGHSLRRRVGPRGGGGGGQPERRPP